MQINAVQSEVENQNICLYLIILFLVRHVENVSIKLHHPADVYKLQLQDVLTAQNLLSVYVTGVVNGQIVQ